MAAIIITTGNRTGWETEARLKLIGSNDTTTLPSATLSAFILQAERNLSLKVVAGGSTVAAILAAGGDDKEFLIDAAISLLCSMLCKGLKVIIAKSERAVDFSETRDLDFDKLQTDLMGEVDVALGQVTTYTAPVASRVGVISRSPAMWEDLS